MMKGNLIEKVIQRMKKMMRMKTTKRKKTRHWCKMSRNGMETTE